jgi:hypothetical protein
MPSISGDHRQGVQLISVKPMKRSCGRYETDLRHNGLLDLFLLLSFVGFIFIELFFFILFFIAGIQLRESNVSSISLYTKHD